MFSVFRVEELGLSLTLKWERFTTFLWNVHIYIENCILIVLREMCRNERVVVTTSRAEHDEIKSVPNNKRVI